jgi:hypothetical protein
MVLYAVEQLTQSRFKYADTGAPLLQLNIRSSQSSCVLIIIRLKSRQPQLESLRGGLEKRYALVFV